MAPLLWLMGMIVSRTQQRLRRTRPNDRGAEKPLCKGLSSSVAPSLPWSEAEEIHTKLLKEVEKMNIEIEEATFKISEVTYQELKEIQAALMNAGSEEALEIGITLEDSLCCLL